MAMTYSSLIAAKGVSGSIANWVSYTKLDLPTILDESQSLIFSLLRTREMRADTQFSMGVGYSYSALPARYLDPIGRMYFTSFNLPARHKDSGFIQQSRNYNELSGTLGTDPFTTVLNSTSVTVALPTSGMTQDSVFSVDGAVLFNGVTLNGTFPVTALASDGNSFTIDISSLGQVPTGSGSGGGSAATYLTDVLVSGMPNYFGVWNERFYFDVAFYQQTLCKLQFYQAPALLSATNPSNWLTDRYPQLIRVATTAAASDFTKDDSEYNKAFARLQAIVERINVENDGELRGMELDPIIP